METVAVTFEDDTLTRLKKTAAESGVPLQAFIASAAEQVVEEREALAASATPEEEASMARAVADIQAGRVSDQDDVFARLDAKHGWS